MSWARLIGVDHVISDRYPIDPPQSFAKFLQNSYIPSVSEKSIEKTVDHGCSAKHSIYDDVLPIIAYVIKSSLWYTAWYSISAVTNDLE